MISDRRKIGIISDTHGVLPFVVHKLFEEVDQIIHAGDIGGEDILIELRTIAPVAAVFGNTDGQALQRKLNERLEFSVGGVDIIVAHHPLYFSEDTKPTIRISGHTHRPLALERKGSWLINPGSAAFPRGEVKPSIAILNIKGGKASVEIVYL